MEIPAVIVDFIGKRIIHRIEKGMDQTTMLVLHCYSRPLSERKGEEAVESTIGSHDDGKRVHLTLCGETTTEEVSDRNFYTGLFTIIPIHSQNQIP